MGTGRIKGITIEIGGDTTGLDKALRDVNKNINSMQRDLKDVNKLLKLDPTNTDLLRQKHDLLQKQISETSGKLDALKEADKQAKKQLESGDLGKDKYDALQREIIETEHSLEELKNTVGSGSATMAQISASTGAFADKTQSAANAIKPLSSAASGLMAAAVATVPATEELRSDLSKLDQNARESGAGIDVAREAFKAFTVVSDETDSSVEATSNLLQAGFTESNLQKAVENLSGAYLRFPDTLKIESLADSLQETLATGNATGQFAELLDRLGIGTDAFAEGLAQCATDAERQNYALQTLADAGLADTYNGWKQNNQALVESKEANQDFQEAMAGIAEAITPIITMVTNFATSLLNWFNSLSPATQNLLMSIIAIVAALTPLISMISGIASGISALTGLLSMSSGLGGVFSSLGTIATTVLGGIKGAVTGLFSLIMAHPVVAIVAAIIATITLLWTKCEWFRDAVTGIWNALKDTAINIWNAVKDFFTGLWDSISSTAETVWNGIKDFFSAAWEAMKNIVQTVAQAIYDHISAKFEACRNIVTTVLSAIEAIATTAWNAIRTAIETALDAVMNVVSTAWGGIEDIISTVTDTVKDIAVNGFGAMRDGIWNAVQSIPETISGIFDSVWGIISNLISSAYSWGSDFISGLKEGIMSKVNSIVESVKGVANKIRSFLHFSRPDEGPLRDYETWMPDFMEGLAKGIRKNSHFVTASVQNLADGMRVGVDGVSIPAQSNSGFDGVLAVLNQYLPYLAQGTELRLDTGTLVGATAPSMNVALGKISLRESKR